MEIRHEWDKGPELLFAECNGRDAKYELSLLEPILHAPEKTGTAIDEEGVATKYNKGIFFSQVYTPEYAVCSPTLKIIEEFIGTSKTGTFTPNSVFQALYSSEGYGVLFSAYRNGGYYKPHRDSCKLTVLYWVGEKDFDGGDLYLPDFDYTINYEPNKLIMMPSFYRHEVTPISTDQEGFVRYCVSAFIN